jgi:hypothetical protein
MAKRAWETADKELVNRTSGARLQARHKGLLQVLPEDAMPSRPRGDAKERTFNLLIRDGIEPRGMEWESRLIGSEPNSPDGAFANSIDIAGDDRERFGEILDDHYVIEVKRARFLFPFQSYLPGTFRFQGHYKMFNGKILAFLCQPSETGSGFNEGLIDRLYELFNGQAGLTLLDATVLEIARNASTPPAERQASASELIDRSYSGEPSGPGALLPEAHRRFQKDLETILAVDTLNRRDQVSAAVNIFYVHLALYFQRLAWLLDEEFGLALDVLADPTLQLDRVRECFSGGWENSPFVGTIQFRVGTGQRQAISMTDGAVVSYRAQNRRQLLLPANLSVLGAAREVMAACGKDAQRWTFADMASACREDPSLHAAFGEGLSVMAVETVAERPEQDQEDISRQVEVGSQGLEVFREALLKTSRSALRRHGRDIVQQLVHRGGRGYISKRGPIFFFEVGQDLLLLLAKVIAGGNQMPFRQFLEELRRYGLEPQSRQEQDRLADALRVLNLLEKHSDAGEAMYVKHFL